MAKSSRLRVMISSRCDDELIDTTGKHRLSDVRRQLKSAIESESLLGRRVFDVWINEDAPPRGGDWDSWDVCMDAVRDCDILLCLATGHAGWARTMGDVGICHAEMMTGLSQAPAKVRVVQVETTAIRPRMDKTAKAREATAARNERFAAYVAQQSLFHGGMVCTLAELLERATSAIADATIALAQSGTLDARRGKFHSGAALDWARLDFGRRQEEIERILLNVVESRGGTRVRERCRAINLDGHETLLVMSAIPAALSIPSALELVGRPFLRDYELAAELERGTRGGPVHIIGCHKGATESQAIRLLGIPDATVVNGPFGIFVADSIQQIQFALIVNCRDETMTRNGVQRFFEWLEQSGEAQLVAKRALSRARIVDTIAAELS